MAADHDTFFKHTFSVPRCAAGLIRSLLPGRSRVAWTWSVWN